MTTIEGKPLPEDAPDPEAHDITPGWVGRNRSTILQMRKFGGAMMVLAPPPARLALAGAMVAADALILADDVKRRLEAPNAGALRGGALVLEAATLLAMSRFAPARLAANLAGIEAARSALMRLKRAEALS
ncbi:MAG: hypothetical protein AAGE80_10030 [Pseudomonadota bacterium]